MRQRSLQYSLSNHFHLDFAVKNCAVAIRFHDSTTPGRTDIGELQRAKVDANGCERFVLLEIAGRNYSHPPRRSRFRGQPIDHRPGFVKAASTAPFDC